MGMGGQRHGPAALFPGKPWYPLYKGLGGPQGRSGRVPTVYLVLTGKELDLYSKGLAKIPLSFFVQNRSDKKVQGRKILSVSFV